MLDYKTDHNNVPGIEPGLPAHPYGQTRLDTAGSRNLSFRNITEIISTTQI
jgi:hypothetical protein